MIGALSCLPAPGIGQQQPTFKSGVEVVVVDVSVVDRTGKPIGDLAPADFQVTVDRKPRTIVSAQFLRYDTRAGAEPVTDVPARPPLTAPTRKAPLPPRNVLMAIDQDSLDIGDGLFARQAAEKFLDSLLASDRVGLATIPRVATNIELTTRHADVSRALSRLATGTDANQYEFNIGIAEAFAIERDPSDADLKKKIVERECGNAGDSSCPARVLMTARQVALDGHSRGLRSIEALRDLGESLARLPGPKTLVLISGGMPMPDVSSADAFGRLEASLAAGQVNLYTIYVRRMPFGRVKDRLSPTPLEDDMVERDGIENATSAAGGTLFDAIGTIDQYFNRVTAELSGAYLLGIEVAAADRDGRPHAVSVRVNREGVDVRARRQYVIEPAPRSGASDRPAVPPKARPGGPPDESARFEAMTPEAEAVIARAGEYVREYETAFSGLVAEERYDQKLYRYERVAVSTAAPGGQRGRQTLPPEEGEWVVVRERQLESDYLLVKAPGGARWLPFRDVYEVDGKKVREREQRLQQLFLEQPRTAAERAGEIMAESARYNIGFIERNLNLPTLALTFLAPENQGRFAFRKGGERVVAGTRAWELAYAEQRSPTMVTTDTGDAPAEGRFWIEAATGRVVRSELRLRLAGTTVEITVTYRPDSKAGRTWVPAEMRESYGGMDRKLECTATYSNIRRFNVTTDVQVPKIERP